MIVGVIMKMLMMTKTMLLMMVLLRLIRLPAANPATVPAQQHSGKEVEFRTRSSSVPCLNKRRS